LAAPDFADQLSAELWIRFGGWLWCLRHLRYLGWRGLSVRFGPRVPPHFFDCAGVLFHPGYGVFPESFPDQSWADCVPVRFPLFAKVPYPALHPGCGQIQPFGVLPDSLGEGVRPGFFARVVLDRGGDFLARA
jgi:hypothetical protein